MHALYLLKMLTRCASIVQVTRTHHENAILNTAQLSLLSRIYAPFYVGFRGKPEQEKLTTLPLEGGGKTKSKKMDTKTLH